MSLIKLCARYHPSSFFSHVPCSRVQGRLESLPVGEFCPKFEENRQFQCKDHVPNFSHLTLARPRWLSGKVPGSKPDSTVDPP
ncbi:hypothetical protein AVEN_34067-1 [Araneus ventricosus]|uniref:Uncharacterized protein n=1 Tax=Araneus ventricosus TaxID=182803 RepID=A0A4Y2JHW7_ARAVE|nr:hypothetical protein AVEN_34067-1 [Araneus ventricosus]